MTTKTPLYDANYNNYILIMLSLYDVVVIIY